MDALPIDSFMQQITHVIAARGAAIVVAEPGAGKTTRVPVGMIRANLPANHQSIVMLQPRRVAARAVAARMAEENGWELGREVGYQVRFEKRMTRDTRIKVVTEGILTRQLLDDPYLDGVGAVVLDEFHERSLNTDVALALLKEVRETVRPELKIVVMSATLDAGPVSEFLGVGAAGVVKVPGRLFPVAVQHAPPSVSGHAALWEHAGKTILRVLEESPVGGEEGDVLVFLPGVGEIERVRGFLAGRLGDVAVLPLHGSLTLEEQQRALRPAGRRKVILSTNIAETSLTIDGVRVVIDSGLARVASFDADRGMDRLDLQRISKASATQRAGRAGRQGPGRAIRLWAESEQKHLEEFALPEVHRVDLAGTVLAVHAWGARDVRRFGWFDPPAEEMLVAAEDLLEMLGALHDGVLTDEGKKMVGLPVHPRIARLLLAAAATGFMDEALNLAAVLSDDSRAGAAGDPMHQLERVPPHLLRVREQLAAIVGRTAPGEKKGGIERAEELLLLAYPDRVARRRENDPYAGVMVGGVGVRLADEALTPAMARAALFLAFDVRHDSRNRKAEGLVRSATPVDEETLRRLFPNDFRSQTVLEYSTEREKVVATARHLFRDLPVRESQGDVHAEKAGAVLAEALARRAEELFKKNDAAARILARVALLRHHMPEQVWPKFDGAQLKELLAEAAAGKKSLLELTEGGALAEALRSTLVYPLDRVLKDQAPETIEVPSGSHMKIAYELAEGDGAPPAPVLAVRLQEVFGWTETPRIAAGRVALVMHLLSPGYRPVQITRDLASFWSRAYFEVRKDLRSQYPKHAWPEDPLTAKAVKKGRSQR